MTAPATALVPATKIQELEAICQEYGLQKLAGMGQIAQTLALAEGIVKLEQAITPEVMRPIMALQGKRLGFLTDKDKDGGYNETIVKRCTIEALLRGVRPVGNEMNIIAGNFYATREAFVRLLREFEGLTELRLDFAVPRMSNGGAVVLCKASWKLNGVPDSMEAEIPVKVNNGMGSDAILGKADRKMRARVFNRLSGSEFPEGDVREDLEEKVVGSGTTSGSSGRTVGMPKAKEKTPEENTEQPPGQGPAVGDLDGLDQLARERGLTSLHVETASAKMFNGLTPPDLDATQWKVLVGWISEQEKRQ